MFPFRKWPVKAFIFEKRATGFSVSSDKARRVVHPTEGEFYQLKKKKVKTRPIKYADVCITKKGQNIAFIYNPEPNEFYPMHIKEGELHAVDEDMRFWHIQQYRHNYERYRKPKMLEKWMPLIIIMVLAIAIAVIWGAMMKDMDSVIHGLGNVANAINNAAEAIASAQVVTPPPMPPPV